MANRNILFEIAPGIMVTNKPPKAYEQAYRDGFAGLPAPEPVTRPRKAFDVREGTITVQAETLKSFMTRHYHQRGAERRKLMDEGKQAVNSLGVLSWAEVND